MSFFYDLNKKLAAIAGTPLNEGKAKPDFLDKDHDGNRKESFKQAVKDAEVSEGSTGNYSAKAARAGKDIGKPGKNFSKIAKNAGARYGSKAAGERVAGAVLNKLRHPTKEGVDQAELEPWQSTMKEADMEEGNLFTKGLRDDNVKIGQKIPGTNATKTKDIDEAGSPMTPKQRSFAKLAPPKDKITFADKIAGAKQEVDEMLGDVAAEAMKAALGKGKQTVQGMAENQPTHFEVHYKDNQKGRTAKTKVKGSNAKQAKAAWNDWNSGNTPGRFTFVTVKPVATEMDEEKSKGTAFDMSTPRAVTPKVGSVERGHKHDIKHTATGRVVTRRTDPQGNSVGADDETDAQAAPRGRGRPKGTKGATGAKGPSGKSKLMTGEDLDTDGVMMTQASNMSSESRDPGEYDQEGDMAKGDIKTIVRHAQALYKILGDNDNLPEWVQSKLAKIESMMIAVDEYMQNQDSDDGEEPISEKAVSKKQQRFMGMVHAAQKGEKPSSKAVGKVARTMKKSDAEDFAKTKHKGLPEKVKAKKEGLEKHSDSELKAAAGKDRKADEKSGVSARFKTSQVKDELKNRSKKEVEETTTAGSVATSTGTTKSKGGFAFGKGVYESLDQRYKQALNEGMTINVNMDEQGHNTLNVTATEEDAMALAQLLKMAGLGSQGHGCPSCGEQSCGCDQMVDENQPNWPTNTETSHNAMQYSGGLNGPKSTGQTTTPVIASQLRRQHSMEESVKLERSLFNTWKNYKG